ncbi:ribonuclease H-like YkuK family protein [Saprospira sp. CCB-QB6]|uniref:ribonuclease H-like YkuK family protein n=1 Tax=Saprospira sp. CCB-QB6 TaxID=3023936 RepID=UPI00234AA523|nr:ribonuclease H-like YkuK family protein [Saprospira sp. CCB-QB6]WCL81429.1 ribonuclease H-like YkuK family protein [Saprospira sp. CCB-QB6]
MNWRKLNGSRILLPIKEAVDKTLAKELAEGHDIKVCIGTDSQVRGKQISFATVIVFLRKGKGGFMYIKPELQTGQMSIRERMITEVAKSVAVAYELTDIFAAHGVQMEVHADISTDSNFKSNVALKEAMGYIRGMGYEFKAKPHAFASSSCADKVV